MNTQATDTLQILSCEDSVPVVMEKPFVGLFQYHLLQPQNGFQPMERNPPNGTFAFSVLLLCAAIIIYLQRNSEGIFGLVFKASFDFNQANQDARVENSQRSRNLYIVQVIALLSIALFVAGCVPHFMDTQKGMAALFFQVIALILGVVVLKRGLLWLFSLLFDLSGEYRIHRFNLSMLFSALGLLLLPLSLLLFFGPLIPFVFIVYLGLGVTVFFYLKGLQRGFLIALSSSAISVLHLFYYFCALEMLPIFVLIRSTLLR